MKTRIPAAFFRQPGVCFCCFQRSSIFGITFPTVRAASCSTLEGRTITMPLGEGLFDFCYADFTRMQQYAMYNCGGSYLLEPVSVPFEDTLYAALFPDRSRKTALLRALQKEYLNLLLFCCDADCEPDVLGDLTAADRYALWCMINGCSPETVHTEIICTGPIHAQHFPEKGEFHLNGAQQTFAQRYGLDQAEMKNALRQIRAIQHVHLCSSLKEMLRLEFTQLLEENVQVRQCRRCRKYFLVKGN